MFIVLPACSNSNVLSTLSYFKTIISLILYVVPSILIVVSGFKLFKIVTSSDPDLKKGMGEIIGKMIGFAAIFFIPMLVTLLTDVLAESGVGAAKDYSECLESATKENIAYYKEKEEAQALLEQEKLKAEKKKADEERKALEKTREKARKENEKRAEEAKKKAEEEKRRRLQQQSSSSSSSGVWNGQVIDGTAQSWKDVVWDPNDVTKISNLTVEQLKAVLRSKGGNATNFIPLAEVYITNEHTNHINALFFISIHAIESGWVTSSVSRACNNLGGWKDFGNPSYVCARAPANEGSTPYKNFNSKGDFIMEVGSSMHKHYLTPGGSHYHGPSVSGIIHDYNCGSQSEINSIISIGNDLFSHVKRVV